MSIVAAVWLWLAGPGRVGTFVRRWGRRGEDWVADRINRTTWRFGPVPRFTAGYGRWIVVVAGSLAAFGLLQPDHCDRAVAVRRSSAHHDRGRYPRPTEADRCTRGCDRLKFWPDASGLARLGRRTAVPGSVGLDGSLAA